MRGREDLQAALCVLAAVVSFAAACSGGGTQPVAGARDETTSAASTEAYGPGRVTGTMTFEGTPPPPRPLRMDADPLCTPEAGAVSERVVVGHNGGLANVFVYVKDGLGNRTYAAPATPVELNQKGCRYVPHVFGVQVGQTVRIANKDATLHNVHASPKANAQFNFGQPAAVPPASRVFDQPEVMVPFRCDFHGWMNAYAGVVAHPFFAVTDADGAFQINGLPVGTYTIGAWHEQLGIQTESINVDGKTPVTLDLKFRSAT